jgi:transcriptional antiterminator Rof (Rho-off)
MDKYKPVACRLYDHFELLAMRKSVIRIEVNGQFCEGIITDLYASEGADWMQFKAAAATHVLRLDKVRVLSQ